MEDCGKYDMKRTCKVVGEIWIMNYDDPDKLVMSVARNMGVSAFLIRLVVHEEIRYLSCKIRKGQFLSWVMKDKRKDCTEKLFNKPKHPLKLNMLCFFSGEKNFGQDDMVNLQNHHWFALFLQEVLIGMKTKHPIHIMIFWVVTLYLHSSSHVDSNSSSGPTSSTWRRKCWPGSKGWPLEGSTFNNRTLRHTTHAGETNVGSKKTSATILPEHLAKKHLIFEISSIIVCGIRLSERQTKIQVWEYPPLQLVA